MRCTGSSINHEWLKEMSGCIEPVIWKFPSFSCVKDVLFSHLIGSKSYGMTLLPKCIFTGDLHLWFTAKPHICVSDIFNTKVNTSLTSCSTHIYWLRGNKGLTSSCFCIQVDHFNPCDRSRWHQHQHPWNLSSAHFYWLQSKMTGRAGLSLLCYSNILDIPVNNTRWGTKDAVCLLQRCGTSLVSSAPKKWRLTRWPVDLFKKEPLKGNSEVHLHTPTKFGEDLSKDLGGVGEQTNKQTNWQTDRQTNAARFIVWFHL